MRVSRGRGTRTDQMTVLSWELCAARSKLPPQVISRRVALEVCPYTNTVGNWSFGKTPVPWPIRTCCPGRSSPSRKNTEGPFAAESMWPWRRHLQRAVGVPPKVQQRGGDADGRDRDRDRHRTGQYRREQHERVEPGRSGVDERSTPPRELDGTGGVRWAASAYPTDPTPASVNPANPTVTGRSVAELLQHRADKLPLTSR